MSRKENPFEKEREEYEQIEIPDELQYLVKKTIMQDKKRRQAKRRSYIMRSVASVAALLFLTLTIGVNSSYAFSKKVSKMPVVKSVAKVLTVRKYTAEKAADEELQKELAAQAQNNPEPVAEVVVEEAIPEEAVQQETPAETTDVPETDEEVLLAGYEKWASELTIEKLDMVTELYEVPVGEEEEVETEVTKQEASEQKADIEKEASVKETSTKETTTKETATKETTAEKKETVAKDAVSGNDKMTEETGQDTKKELTADASKESEDISKEAEDDKSLDTILLAELPKEEIRLYGYHENGAVRGVALRIKDRFTCFDWTYLDSRGKIPELSYADANEDGEKEILVFLYNDKKDTQEEETDSDLESADSETAVKNAAEETTTDSKTSNKETKPETEEAKSEVGKSSADANKATSTTDTQKTEADLKNSDTSKSSEANKGTSADNKEKDVTDKTLSESEKTSVEVTVSANDQEEEPDEIKSLDDVSEIWMVSVSEEGMKPELVSREEEESPILAFIKSLFEK
ncbi:MAG: hypothetical protein ACI4FV_09705 [Lachnospiraceae bacterium]